MDFIQRKFQNIEDGKHHSFDEILNLNDITIILGEPASGKTHQLRYYSLNTSNTKFIDLISIEDEEPISNDVNVVLLDSIDEALTLYQQDKVLKNKLHKFIDKCLTINPSVKFVISCRYLEWNEIFQDDLKTISKSFNVYNIVELTKEDIDKILKQEDIDIGEFWEYIEKNYLTELLRNILMTINVIKNFNEYKISSISYIEIYKKIVEEHLTVKTENASGEAISKFSLQDIRLIVSSLAAYMTLNRKKSLNIKNIDLLADELYGFNNITINGEKLKTILDTTLFVGATENVSFFHRSIQEFMCAFFVNEKKMSIEAIEKIFSYKYRFYEEFEEVIIYLTNLEDGYFKYFVNFDPLIFRRHPNLTSEQQILLLISMLNLLQSDRQKVWGKWEYLHDSTLVYFSKISNIADVVQSHINTMFIGNELFAYLLGILEHNYSKQLEDIIFEILENLKSKHSAIKYIRHNIINTFEYNNRLFDFVIENNLLDHRNERLNIHLFKILYKKRHFKEIVILLKKFSIYTDKEVILKIDGNDLNWWLCTIITDCQLEKRINNERISFLIFTLLQKQKDQFDFENIVNFIIKNHIHLNFYVGDYEKEKYILCFSDIKNVFWNFYFNKCNPEDSRLWKALEILSFYDIKVSDIVEIAMIFPIEKYIEHYIGFRRKIVDIDVLLMANSQFKSHMENIWARHEKLERKYASNDKQWVLNEYRKKVRYIKSKATLSTFLDVKRIYFYNNRVEANELSNKLITELGEVKYQKFITLIQKEFEQDTSYNRLKNEIPSNSICNDRTYLYHFLFSNINEKSRNTLIYDKHEYGKLFWHMYRYFQLSSDYFVELTSFYLEEFKRLYIEVIHISLSNSGGTLIGFDYHFKSVFEKLGVFNNENLVCVIDELKSILDMYFSTLIDNDKESLLEIISLDKNNYEYVKDMMLKDKFAFLTYMNALLTIDLNKAISDYIEIFYPKGDMFIKFSLNTLKSKLYPIYRYNRFDNLCIKPAFLKAYKQLHGLMDHNHSAKSSLLNNANMKFILEKYYLFFKDYEHPIGSYSPDIYDNMNDRINSILNFLGEDSEQIEFLEELNRIDIERFQAVIKRTLERAYNQRLTDRNYSSEYYKNFIENNVKEEDSQRFFDYDRLKDDLLELLLGLTESRRAIFKESEDETNDRLRQLLRAKGYFILDQSRGGESESGKSAGERDLVVCNKHNNIAECIIEALQLHGLDTTNIIKHYTKLIKKYDTLGNKRNFILVYSKMADFDKLWHQYKGCFPDLVEIEDSTKSNLNIGMTKYENMEIYHLFVNFYSS